MIADRIAGKAKVSVWEARLATKRLQRNRQRVCVGHFCSGSYSAPRGDRFALELTDLGVNGVQTSKWLGLVVKQQMPHPSRYHLVWALQSGTTPVFFWQPGPAGAPGADSVVGATKGANRIRAVG